MTGTPHDGRGTRPNLVIRGAAVVTGDPRLGDFDRADILVGGDTITAVGSDLHEAGADAETVIEADNMIALPGFVDSHVHAWEGQLRGQEPAIDFGELMRVTAAEHGPRYRPQDNYAGTLLTALAALDCGITTIVDNAHNARTPEHAQASVEALDDAGIRGVHAVGSPFGTSMEHVPSTAIALRDRYGSGLISIRLFDVHPTVELWQCAKDADLWVSTELGPHTPGLDERFEALATADLLTPQHALNHCYDLSETIWKRIADSGCAVNLAPRSAAAFGLGSTVAPVDMALGHAAAVGLSSDNELSYGISMFAEMQALSLRSRSDRFRDRHATGGPPAADPLTPARLLQMATSGGAANAGLSEHVGTLAPGKKADIVLVRADDIATLSAARPVATLVTIAHPGSVDTVLVAGRVRKRHGRLLDVDRGALRRLQEESYRHVAS